jgi:hypothetical protein
MRIADFMRSSQKDGGAIAAAVTGLLPVSFRRFQFMSPTFLRPTGIDRCSRTTAANIILRIENLCNDY